jgi:hypothetical protein
MNAGPLSLFFDIFLDFDGASLFFFHVVFKTSTVALANTRESSELVKIVQKKCSSIHIILYANNKKVHNYRNFFKEENIMYASKHVYMQSENCGHENCGQTIIMLYVESLV